MRGCFLPDRGSEPGSWRALERFLCVARAAVVDIVIAWRTLRGYAKSRMGKVCRQLTMGH
jgi:hypothetical protein